MRDLNEDLAICEAATPGPLRYMESVHADFPYEICECNFLDTIAASAIRVEDARFIAEAREGWPEAIRRAIAAERENSEIRDRLMNVFQKARNDVARWDGGQCVGLPVFQDRVYARRLVRDLQPMLFPAQIKEVGRDE